MNEMVFAFEHEGRTVLPGQEMYVHPRLFHQAGAKAKVERYFGDSVLLRTANGAIPTVSVSDISWDEYPTARATKELVLAGFRHPTSRHIAIWIAAQNQATEAKRGAA